MSALFSHINPETVWLAVGFLGQGLFFMRFFVQWIASEKKGESIIPNAFWYFSIGGGLVLLSYAIWRQDPVFILGQSTGLLIYSRNLYFIHRKVPDGAADVSETSN
ncbi:MAG: lipid-A-disaccharide synthase N-terminal domain-containing protein [Rhodospirillales bacterium]|nr:lipid-A-disaccharide synthase N-terminal domain-containing protein [Rhodospirillales bacterium]